MKVPELKIKVTRSKGDLVTIKNSKSVFEILQNCFDHDTIYFNEEMILLALNRRNHVIGYYRISKGGMSATILDNKIVFSILLNCGAHNFILAHNHPSGDTSPSQEDIDITYNIKKAGKLLDINLLDHLICSETEYYSFADNGLL